MSDDCLVIVPVPTIVGSCFYGELRASGSVTANGVAAYADWSRTLARNPNEPYEEPQLVKAREDLALCGQEQFVCFWEHLLLLCRSQGTDTVYELLHGVLGPSCDQARAEAEARRGKA